MGYITIHEAAERWHISERRIQMLCRNHRIQGALKFGRDWAIPEDAKKPDDRRIKDGSYIGWRDKLRERREELHRAS